MAELTSVPCRPAPLRGWSRSSPLSAAALRVTGAFGNYLHALETLGKSTMRAYLSDIRHFACWFETDLGGRMFGPEDLSPPLLARSLVHLESLRLKPASIRALVALKRFCGWAQHIGLASGDPARNVRFVRLVPTAPHGLTDLEEAALIRSVTQHGFPRDQAVVVVMRHTGLRAGETCQLEGRDLILEADRGTLWMTGRGRRVREAALGAAARTAIRNYHPAVPGPSARLFPSTRHRFGSVMAAQVPLRWLARMMGHDSLKTTALYTRASAGALQAEVEETTWR